MSNQEKEEQRFNNAIDLLYEAARTMLGDRPERLTTQKKILEWLSKNDE